MLPKWKTGAMTLAQSVEAAEAANLAAIAAAGKGMEWAWLAGGVAVFAGVGAPFSHAIGVGMSGGSDLETVEQFFHDRGSPCVIDLCSKADPAAWAFIHSRGYREQERSIVMVREPGPAQPIRECLRIVPPHEMKVWTRMMLEAFSDGDPADPAMLRQMETACSASECWVVERTRFLGGAALAIHDGVGLIYADAVLPEARGEGWQAALIDARLASARTKGCHLAAASVLPGSGSQRNYERAGFREVYRRVNLVREW